MKGHSAGANADPFVSNLSFEVIEMNAKASKCNRFRFVLVFMLSPMAVVQAAIEWVQPTTGVSIAVDAFDNVYTVNHVYAPGGDIILTKRQADGTLLWERSFDQTDSTKWEQASWVAADGSGNAIVCGTIMSGYSNPVRAASVAMKFAPDGTLLWRRVYENSFDGSYTRKCLVDSAANVYVLGMGVGPSGFVTKVKKFSPDGAALWSYFDADGIGAPINIKFTPDGKLVITGRASTGSLNGYAKIDLNGNKIWSVPGVSSLTVGDSAGDSAGNTYLVHGEYTLNGGTVIKKVDPNGNLLWENIYPLAGFRIDVGQDNRAVVSGFPNANTGGAAFIKVDENGGTVWQNLDADGPLALLLHAQMLLDGSDNAYLAAGTMTAMAVCRVNSDGTSGGTQTVTGGGYANGIALSSDATGIFVVGGTTARLSNGPASNPQPPAAPTNLQAVAQRVGSRARVALTWADNAVNETGYRVERCTGNGCSSFATRASLPPDSTTFLDSSVARRRTYRYRVVASGEGGNAASEAVTVTTP